MSDVKIIEFYGHFVRGKMKKLIKTQRKNIKKYLEEITNQIEDKKRKIFFKALNSFQYKTQEQKGLYGK